MRFSKSKIVDPASTTVIASPGLSSDSFCASIAAEIPPPITQRSVSWTLILGLVASAFRQKIRRAFRRKIRSWQSAARVAADRGAVAEIVRRRGIEVMAHEIGGDVSAGRTREQAFDPGLRDRCFDDRASLLACRGNEACGSLHTRRCIEGSNLRRIILRGGRTGRAHARVPVAVIRIRTFLVVPDPLRE